MQAGGVELQAEGGVLQAVQAGGAGLQSGGRFGYRWVAWCCRPKAGRWQHHATICCFKRPSGWAVPPASVWQPSPAALLLTLPGWLAAAPAAQYL